MWDRVIEAPIPAPAQPAGLALLGHGRLTCAVRWANEHHDQSNERGHARAA
jgi:hypothetical protein